MFIGNIPDEANQVCIIFAKAAFPEIIFLLGVLQKSAAGTRTVSLRLNGQSASTAQYQVRFC